MLPPRRVQRRCRPHSARLHTSCKKSPRPQRGSDFRPDCWPCVGLLGESTYPKQQAQQSTTPHSPRPSPSRPQPSTTPYRFIPAHGTLPPHRSNAEASWQSVLREILSRLRIRQKNMRGFQCLLCSCSRKPLALSSTTKAPLHQLRQRFSLQPTTKQPVCAATPIYHPAALALRTF